MDIFAPGWLYAISPPLKITTLLVVSLKLPLCMHSTPLVLHSTHLSPQYELWNNVVKEAASFVIVMTTCFRCCSTLGRPLKLCNIKQKPSNSGSAP